MDILIDCAYRPEDLEGLPLEELCRFVLTHEEQPEGAEVSIAFVDDATIARLNEEYRGKIGPTDVLSFECDGAEGPVECDGAFPSGEVWELGDVVIAVDVADRQREIYGTTFRDEIELLLTHGLLHLCGYDHMEPDDAAVMEPLQEELLAAWKESGHET